MAETEYVSSALCEEHMKRFQEENDRQNHRLTNLENEVKQISELVSSVKVLATNIEGMNKELAKQGERLEKIEDRPAKRWESVVAAVIAGVVGLLFGLISAGIIH